MLGGMVELTEVRVADVAELVLRIDKMVATIDVSVVLHHESIAACLGEGAERGGNAAPLGKGVVEKLYEDAPHVGAYPFVIDIADELSEGFWVDGVGRRSGFWWGGTWSCSNNFHKVYSR